MCLCIFCSHISSSYISVYEMNFYTFIISVLLLVRKGSATNTRKAYHSIPFQIEPSKIHSTILFLNFYIFMLDNTLGKLKIKPTKWFYLILLSFLIFTFGQMFVPEHFVFKFMYYFHLVEYFDISEKEELELFTIFSWYLIVEEILRLFLIQYLKLIYLQSIYGLLKKQKKNVWIPTISILV